MSLTLKITLVRFVSSSATLLDAFSTRDSGLTFFANNFTQAQLYTRKGTREKYLFVYVWYNRSTYGAEKPKIKKRWKEIENAETKRKTKNRYEGAMRKVILWHWHRKRSGECREGYCTLTEKMRCGKRIPAIDHTRFMQLHCNNRRTCDVVAYETTGDFWSFFVVYWGIAAAWYPDSRQSPLTILLIKIVSDIILLLLGIGRYKLSTILT